MKVKICGLFRDEDVDYVNRAEPDYCGFVFADSKRKVAPLRAAVFRERLLPGIIPVGVFVNASIDNIVTLYREGVIAIAQLHGNEDAAYIDRLKNASANSKGGPVPVIKVIQAEDVHRETPPSADYYLFDSGAGSGRTFDWNILNSSDFSEGLFLGKPWFLAGGIRMENIEAAMAVHPFAVDISGGAETDGVKDAEKILELTSIVRRKGNML